MKETCENKAIPTRSCKISTRILHYLARSCKTSCKNLATISFFLNKGAKKQNLKNRKTFN